MPRPAWCCRRWCRSTSVPPAPGRLSGLHFPSSAQARDLIDAAIGKARENGRPFEEVVREDRDIRRHLETDALRDALDPAHALGESSQLIDRALARHRSMERATDA
ncbi:MAG: hypothetical protein E6I88_14710 [Chloroflexi bacterium]|nr:MAG: hypothetical protein E6I88_14710 [Chloroflexota bacterium]